MERVVLKMSTKKWGPRQYLLQYNIIMSLEGPLFLELGCSCVLHSRRCLSLQVPQACTELTSLVHVFFAPALFTLLGIWREKEEPGKGEKERWLRRKRKGKKRRGGKSCEGA
jgi:hypothetical protein